MNPPIQPGTVDELAALYRETIVRHAVQPVGYRLDIDASHRGEMFNALCGDRIEMLLRIETESIKALAFHGEACAICMASASLLCEQQVGHPVARLETTHIALQGALETPGSELEFESLRPLLGVRAYPSRVKCALLPWEAALKALDRA